METLIKSNLETNANIDKLEKRVEEIANVKEAVDDHEDRIEVLEAKVNAILAGNKKVDDDSEDDWSVIANKENMRRKKVVALVDSPSNKDTESTGEKETYAERLKKNLKYDADLSLKSWAKVFKLRLIVEKLSRRLRLERAKKNWSQASFSRERGTF